MAGCNMTGEMPKAPADNADHAKKDCCVPACQASAATAFLPQNDRDSAGLAPEQQLHIGLAAKELASFQSSGLDPPPRLPS